MKSLIVVPGASRDYIEDLAKKINSMESDDSIVCTHDVKIYDIENAVCWNRQQIKEFLKSSGIKYEPQ